MTLSKLTPVNLNGDAVGPLNDAEIKTANAKLDSLAIAPMRETRLTQESRV